MLAATCGDGVRRTDLNENEEGYEFCDDGKKTPMAACPALWRSAVMESYARI